MDPWVDRTRSRSGGRPAVRGAPWGLDPDLNFPAGPSSASTERAATQVDPFPQSDGGPGLHEEDMSKRGMLPKFRPADLGLTASVRPSIRPVKASPPPPAPSPPRRRESGI